MWILPTLPQYEWSIFLEKSAENRTSEDICGHLAIPMRARLRPRSSRSLCRPARLDDRADGVVHSLFNTRLTMGTERCSFRTMRSHPDRFLTARLQVSRRPVLAAKTVRT